MGLYRMAYNRALDTIKECPDLSKFDLRDLFTDHALPSEDRLLSLMANIRTLATFEAHKNYKTAQKNKTTNWYKNKINQMRKLRNELSTAKKETTKERKWEKIMDIRWEMLFVTPYDINKENKVYMNYKTKKDSNCVIDIPKAAVAYDPKTKIISIAPKAHKISFKLKEAPKDCMMKDGTGKFKHDLKLIKCPTGYYLQVPFKEHENEKVTNGKVLSLDPGIRTFLNGVDSDGNIVEYGHDCIGKLDGDIRKRNFKTFKSGETIPKSVSDRRYLKVYNKVLDMHRKITKDINEYSLVILPKLGTKDICIGKSNKFCDNAHILAPCKFYDRVNLKLGKRHIEADESFTSKTCCKCEKMTNIGESKTFSCSHCGFVLDRDINAAINILFKNI